MKKLNALIMVLIPLLFTTMLFAGEDAPATQIQPAEAERAEYESMLEEAEKARAEAETARREAVMAAEKAREISHRSERVAHKEAARHRQLTEEQKVEMAREQEEMKRAREELSRSHRALREASREVARAHRDLSRSGKSFEITHTLNLGDRAVIGVVLGKKTETGVEIIGVSPDGPAERAGLQQGDVLVSIRGVDLAKNDQAREAVFGVMREVGDGEELAVMVDRGGESWEYTVIAEQREPRGWQSVIRIPEIAPVPEAPESERVIIERIEIEGIDEEALAARVADLTEKLEAREFMFITENREEFEEFDFEEFSDFGGHAMSEANVWFGLPHAHGLELASINEGLGSYFNTDRGVLVVRARQGNAYQLESGDVILSIGASRVDSPSDMMRALRDVEPSSEIAIEIKRNRKDKTLNVVVPENRLGHR